MRRSINAAAYMTFVLGCCGVAAAHDPIRATFTTVDGVEIVGDYWTPLDMTQKAPVVILLHMYRSDRTAWHPQVVALEHAGFAIMAIDMRGHGESVRPTEMNLTERVMERDSTLFNAMYHDVAGAYSWLAKRPEVDMSRVAVVGASIGCSVALDYARRDRSVDVVVQMTPGSDYLGVDSIAHIKAYGPRHVMMLTSEEERDRGVAPLSAEAAKTDTIVDKAVFQQTNIHGTRMYGTVDGVDKRIADYLAEHVGKPSSAVVFAAFGGDRYYHKDHPAVKGIKADDLRVFSTAAEASQRGLKAAEE